MLFNKKKKAAASGVSKKQAKDLAKHARKLGSKAAVKRVNKEQSY